MGSRDRTSASVPGSLFDILAVPYNFLSGYFLGLLAPAAAITAVVAGMRFLTGQVPFLRDVSEGEGGARRLSLELMSPEQVKEAFDERKEDIGGPVAKMRAEIQAIIEEAQAEARSAAQEETELTVEV